MANNKILEAIVNIAGQLDPSLQKAIAGASKQFGVIKKAAAVTGAVTVAGMASVATATIAATKELYNLGVEFDGAVDTIRIGTGATGEALDALYADMKEVYKNVPTTMEDASSAIADYNTRLGLTGEPLQQLSQQAIQVCDMLGEDLSTTIEKSSKAFQQWEVDTNDMSNAMDYVFKVSQSTGTGFNDLMTNMQSYGAQLQEMGFGFDEAAVLIGQLDKAGVNATEVLGAMKKSVSALAAEGLSASEGMELYYDSILNAQSATEATAIASEIFGTRAASTMSAAIRDGSLSITDLTTSLRASTETINGAATDTYDFAEQFQLLKQNAQIALEPIATEIFNLANEIMPYLQEAFAQILPIFSSFGETLIPVLEDLGQQLFPIITVALSQFGSMAEQFLPFVAETISRIASFAGMLLPILMDIAVAVMPLIETVLQVIFDVLEQLMPVFSEIITSIMPVLKQLIITLVPIISQLFTALSPIITLMAEVVSAILPPIVSLLNYLMPIIQFYVNIFATELVFAMQALMPVIEVIVSLFGGLMDIVTTIFSSLAGIVKEPINEIISFVNMAIEAINGISITVPDWVPGIGGQIFGFELPTIPMLATGGFTNGPSIAGEAGTEAVISFDSAYREENLSYWAKAGRMLGVDDTFLSGIESGNTSGNPIQLEVTYAPHIEVHGTSKEDVIEALKEREEDFMDMLEDMLRRVGGDSYNFGY